MNKKVSRKMEVVRTSRKRGCVQDGSVLKNRDLTHE